MIVVRVPASSANLGPGFDALGMALTLYAEVHVGTDGDDAAGSAAARIESTHPAAVAFRTGGGDGDVRLQSPIPSGRGLGFSGAMRVGGLLAATAQRRAAAGDDSADRLAVLQGAVELEGHADNVAASLLGGVVATAGGHAVPLPLGLSPAVVVWVPETGTSTQRSRNALPATVSFADAAFNVGRTALLAAAFAAGDVAALRAATEDRLHQDRRFSATPESRRALAAGLEAGAWGGWLSGSGPAVALLCDPGRAEPLADEVAGGVSSGRTMVLAVDTTGATVELC
ncbi:MAG: homoserine kinase [Ilumatobacteraceae bacterium]